MSVKVLNDGIQQADFQLDFALEGKGLEADVDENGDLWIQGYASDYLVDRQEEAFEPGSFEKGLKAYLDTNPILLYHHKYDQALGQVAEADLNAKGLFIKARVDAPAAGSWAEDVFNKIRKGTIKAFSVGGIFKRKMTEAGPRIFDVDLGEISVTPFPVNPRTTFAVVAGKAFADAPELEKEEEVVEVAECEDCKVRADEAEAYEIEAANEAEAAATQAVKDNEELSELVSRLERIYESYSQSVERTVDSETGEITVEEVDGEEKEEEG